MALCTSLRQGTLIPDQPNTDLVRSQGTISKWHSYIGVRVPHFWSVQVGPSQESGTHISMNILYDNGSRVPHSWSGLMGPSFLISCPGDLVRNQGPTVFEISCHFLHMKGQPKKFSLSAIVSGTLSAARICSLPVSHYKCPESWKNGGCPSFLMSTDIRTK